MTNTKKNVFDKFILDNFTKNWNYSSLSSSPMMTISFIKTINEKHTSAICYPEKDWDWYTLSYDLHYCFIHLEEWFAAQKIQKWWLEMYYNPNKKVCKKRLHNEFETLNICPKKQKICILYK